MELENMDVKIFIICFCFFLWTGIAIFAEESLDFSAEKSGVEKSANITFAATTEGEMQAGIVGNFVFPFLQGNHPLTSGNNIALQPGLNLTPVSVCVVTDVDLTVASFLKFSLGAKAGTGWNYEIFDIPLKGLGRHDIVNDKVIGNGADGLFWNLYGGATVQFDLAALYPGDWNHVMMRVYNEVLYQAYTNVRGDELWYWQNDDGMNQNVFKYSFSVMVGYAMPIFLDLIGFQLSGSRPFYNPETGDGVAVAGAAGFDFTLAALLRFKISEQWSIMAITQFENDLLDNFSTDYKREWGFDCVQIIAEWHLE
jgi:hypothetical protein